MGEVAATVNAFDSEFAKALKNLQLRKGNHEVKDSVNTNERISTWQQLEKLGELIDHFFSKLPLHVGVPKLLEKADELHRKVERLNLLSPETVSKEINDKDRRKYEVRARFGSAMCEATLVQEADPGMRHPHTLASLLAVLAKVQSGVQVVLPDEEHYWLVFNGTVLLYSVAAPLITAGFAAEVVEYLVFAVLALENVLLLCAPKYLDWRLQLCKAVCQCYIDLKVPEEAEKFAARALDKIKEQVHLESLDPLPLTESSEAVYKASENNLNVLLFRTQHESLANADAVLAKLEETFSAEGDRLRALIEAVREPTRRTVRHSAPAERIQLLLEVSLKVVEPHLQAFATADEARSALEKGQTIVASMPPPVEGEPVPIPEPEPAPPPPAPAKGGKENPGSKKGKKGAAEPEKLLGENAPEAGPPNIPALEAALAEAIKAMENTCQAFPMVLHIRLLTAGYTYEQPWFDDVLKAAKQRLSQAADYDGGVLEERRPIRGVLEERRPIRGVLEERRPIRGVLEERRPIRGVLEERWPIRGVTRLRCSGMGHVQAGAFFGRLDMKLLEPPPPAPPSTEEGETPEPDAQPAAAPLDANVPEVLALQEYILALPDFKEFEGEILQARVANAEDTAAQVLTQVQADGPVKAWTTLQASSPVFKEPDRTPNAAGAPAAGGKGGKDDKKKDAKKKDDKKGAKGGAAASTPRTLLGTYPLPKGYEKLLDLCVAIVHVAIDRGMATEAKQWIEEVLGLLKQHVTAPPPDFGDPPPKLGELEVPEDRLEEMKKMSEEDKAQVMAEVEEEQRRERAAKVLQNQIPVLLAWRRCTVHAREVRAATYQARAQLQALFARLLFETEHKRLEDGGFYLGQEAWESIQAHEKAREAAIAEEVPDGQERPELPAPPELPPPPSKEVVTALARAVVLAGRGKCWIQESREVMQALVNLMLATKAVEEEASGDHLLGLAEVLYTCSDVVYRQLPDAITDAGLLVWSLVRTLLAAMLEPTGKPIEVDPVQKTLATDLLYKLHVIFTKLDLDDAMLRALLAQRLGLFLEEAGRVDDARFVLDGALQAMYAFRGHFTARARGAADENRRFISAVNLPGEQLAPGTGVGETEQAFACLQADVFQLRGRIELKIGLREQQAKAKRRKERVLKQVEKRDQQTLIFGKKTDKEHAHDHERIIQAEECLPNPVLTEAELLQTADKNHYERALVLLQMAPFHPTVAKRSQLLQEAAKELQAAQAMEARLLQMASAPPQTPTRGRPKVPPPPRVMTVNTTEVTVEPVQVALASARTATQYAVFCKPLGSGVGVSLNNTEFEGTGVFLPIEDRATIRGLRQNESYIFAVAFYDDKCAIVNGLGASTQEVVTLFPLPVLLCWAYLCLGATRLGCTSVAKQACGVIFKHFFLRKASEPLWAANPFDSLDLNKDNILAASLPLLRSVVQVLYVGGELSTTGLGLIPNLPDAAYIEVQTARLRAARRYVLGMMVSAYLADEALLNEGALRFYNGIAPLLTLRSRSSHLSKALAACHMTLHQLRSLRDEQTVAVLASITYELVHLYRNLDERQVSLLA
eukprot:gene1514-2148_t